MQLQRAASYIDLRLPFGHSGPIYSLFDIAQKAFDKQCKELDSCIDDLPAQASGFNSIEQLNDWVWVISDWRKQIELGWAASTGHRGMAVRWMGLQGFRLGAVGIGRHVLLHRFVQRV